MNDKNLQNSLIRTVVPVIVGSLLSLPIAPRVLEVLNVTTEQAASALTAAVTGILTYLYYLIARLLERRFPAAGVLLLSRSQPVYPSVPQQLPVQAGHGGIRIHIPVQPGTYELTQV